MFMGWKQKTEQKYNLKIIFSSISQFTINRNLKNKLKKRHKDQQYLEDQK